MWLLSKNGIRSNKAQSIIEYAIVASIIAAALGAMSTYMFRAAQATQQNVFAESRTD